VKKIAGKQIAVLSAGTDGVDGNSPAAGAVADGETFERGQAAGLEARHMFSDSDSHSYFARLGDTIVTGPTGNNLRDLRILLAEPEERTNKKKS
jgi:hydroxypyruvate reductase